MLKISEGKSLIDRVEDMVSGQEILIWLWIKRRYP